jgi:NAD(P)H-quinone oxidoreductase subunit 5
VFRQVFLDQPHPKTRRTPEVNWLMALPMVSLTVLVTLVPWIMTRLDPVPGLASFSWSTGLLVIGSSLAGGALAVWVPLDKFDSRSVLRPLRVLQDLLAFDFYTDRIYRATIVAFVAQLAKVTNAFDNRVVNGLVNWIGTSSLASAETLKLSVSGQLQSYVLTVVVAIVVLFSVLAWVNS